MIVTELWAIFDHDASGTITLQEFVSRGGLCDTIVAQMPPQPPPPAYIPPGSFQVRCGQCSTGSISYFLLITNPFY